MLKELSIFTVGTIIGVLGQTVLSESLSEAGMIFLALSTAYTYKALPNNVNFNLFTAGVLVGTVPFCEGLFTGNPDIMTPDVYPMPPSPAPTLCSKG